MSGSVLDCRGLSCPLPVIRVKEKLEKGAQTFSVLVDARIAVENITRFLGHQGIAFTVSDHGPESRIEVKG